MFQFTAFPSIRYGFTYGYLRFAQVGFPIQISPDRWLFAPPRSFSQLTTSFIGSQCQGILLVLFLAWPVTILRIVFFRKSSFLSGMFRCSDTTFVTFENRKFCFLDWLYFCFTCIQFSRCKLFWRFDPSKPNNEYLSQPCVEKCLRKTIRNASHYFALLMYLLRKPT